MARANAHSLRLDGRGLDRVGRCKGKLLDIGCGNGSFLGMAEQAGWECYGVEPDREAESIAAAQGIKILGSHLDELRGRFDSYFEIVTLNHVIEHVHDPTQTLCDCWAMLKPGGFVWLETPNIDSIGYQIYSRSWRGLEPPRHLVLFNRHALSTCLTNAGFNDIHVLPPRDAVSYTFSRSAYVAAGSLAEGNPAPLSTAENIILKTNMRRARRLVCTNPERSEFISAMAYKS
jgi:2-polyprenyl-3-methyl-5-hydroxy-6-metoxy-1,4-benzoquinol methylase